MECALLRAAIERFAHERQIANVIATKTHSPQAMLSELRRMRKGLFSMVVCSMRDEGAPDALRHLRRLYPDLRIVLVSDQKADALTAFDINASMLLIPDSKPEFEKAIGEPLRDIADKQSAAIVLKTSFELSNVPLDDVLFAENAKRGPIVHLPGEKTVSTRGSLQALYERLARADTERFVKVGGSFVVNLDNVRSFSKGTLIFCNGETIIVPVRMRASLKETLSSYLTETQAEPSRT